MSAASFQGSSYPSPEGDRRLQRVLVGRFFCRRRLPAFSHSLDPKLPVKLSLEFA